MIVSAAAASNPLSDNLPFSNETTPRQAMTNHKKMFMLDLKTATTGAGAAHCSGKDGHNEDAITIMDSGPISADRVRKHNNTAK